MAYYVQIKNNHDVWYSVFTTFAEEKAIEAAKTHSGPVKVVDDKGDLRWGSANLYKTEEEPGPLLDRSAAVLQIYCALLGAYQGQDLEGVAKKAVQAYDLLIHELKGED